MVKRGLRLVQAVSHSGGPVSLVVVKELGESSRGSGAFGSTGDAKPRPERRVHFSDAVPSEDIPSGDMPADSGGASSSSSS